MPMWLEPSGGGFLQKKPVLKFVAFEYVTPGPRQWPVLCHIGADPVDVGEQGQVMAESLLTVLDQRTWL